MVSEFEKCNQQLKQNNIDRRVHFLQDTTIEIYGIRIHGVSWESVCNEDFSQITQHRVMLMLFFHIKDHILIEQSNELQDP